MKSNILILDGYNLLHRARYSMAAKRAGEHGMTFSFFRSLKTLVEKFNPDKIYFVLEGYPKHRHTAVDNYKANRERNDDNSFHQQKDDIISLCKKSFPVTVVRHPDFECDDTIAYLARERHVANSLVTIVSTDTDFIQLLQCPHVSLYNPVRKEFIQKTPFNYVFWKALRGDSADNIAGFKGIGDKRALKILESQESFLKFMETQEIREKFATNCFLINLHDYLLKDDLENLEEINGNFDWKECRKFFVEREFKSLTQSRYSENFRQIFEKVGKQNEQLK